MWDSPRNQPVPEQVPSKAKALTKAKQYRMIDNRTIKLVVGNQSLLFMTNV